MPIWISPKVLLRAPLLSARDLEVELRELAAHPLVEEAMAHASRELRTAKDTSAAERARRRLLMRAAFRATPRGPWAGVAMAELGQHTFLATGTPRLHTRPSFAQLFGLARARLDEPDGREGARLRLAPSALLDADEVRWLSAGPDGLGWRSCARDQVIDALVTATQDWCAWNDVSGAAARGLGQLGEQHPPEALDDLLLELVDAGLLVSDLAPRLIGPSPLDQVSRTLGVSSVAALPHDHVTLVHQPARRLVVARTAVERAAELAPLLFRLQAALAPPVRERDLDPELASALEAITEPLGTGALAPAALAFGAMGVSLPEGELPPAPWPQPPPALVAYLVDVIVTAVSEGTVVRLDARRIDELAAPLAPPPSFELMLAPARAPRGTRPGTGWLLGLHAPAGATWGRFAEALGQPMSSALAELAAAERRLRPDEEHLDVAFAPDSSTADVACHPPVRGYNLAITDWPFDDRRSIAAAELELVVDPGALWPLGWRSGARAAVPSPLSRLRSTLAPRGLAQLLTGWSLWRQHAPWALTLGGLGALTFCPRIELDGFVVAPASWAIPDEVAAGDRKALARWRKQQRVPRWIQVGHEDELLPIDLDASWAAAELARLGAPRPRAVEIWPPLGQELDSHGRRVELVAQVVTAASAHDQAAARAVGRAGQVPAPHAAPGWKTVAIYGAAERAERVLVEHVGPLLERHPPRAWFFLRYVEQGRPHLRLRLREGEAALAALEAALEPARQAGDVVDLAIRDYHRELARYGDDQVLEVLETIWQAESELALATALELEPAERTPLVVSALDALTAGIGLGPGERQAFAQTQRLAHGVAGAQEGLSAMYRSLSRELAQAVTDPLPGVVELRRQVASTATRLAPTTWLRILPALCHLLINRLVGTGSTAEAAAMVLWQRTLEGVSARGRR